jgi:hypothetical protein
MSFQKSDIAEAIKLSVVHPRDQNSGGSLAVGSAKRRCNNICHEKTSPSIGATALRTPSRDLTKLTRCTGGQHVRPPSFSQDVQKSGSFQFQWAVPATDTIVLISADI